MTAEQTERSEARSEDARVLLEVRNLVVWFSGTRGFLGNRQSTTVRAVDDVSFELRQGETVSLVGESGCGKTTTGRAVVGLERPRSGSIGFAGQELIGLRGRQAHRVTRNIQMVFQDPYSSLNPRMTVGTSIAEPLAIHGIGSSRDRRQRVVDLLEAVGLRRDFASQLPYQFSGGQRQRIALARALALNPQLLILDEPTSALDVSIQAQILNLLADLREKFSLTYLFISHDLATVRWLADRVVVMYLGRIMEAGSADLLFQTPRHPYTIALLSALPVPDPDAKDRRKRIVLQGETPSAHDIPRGCRFAGRCWLWGKLGSPEKCQLEEPELLGAPDHQVACHFSDKAAETDGVISTREVQE